MTAAAQMDWERLLCTRRLGREDYAAQANRPIFVQDHDRIVFSAPFRRLANKTQVQPLYENDHVHHRLIHSVEVASVGRSLAMRIGNWLANANHIAPLQAQDLADVVQAACVAHDIGNPPFGHSGETSMGDWFAARISEGQGLFADLDPGLHGEFTAFEGNAQGFRILTRLEMYREAGGMQLSMATLGAFAKYPVTAAEKARLEQADLSYVGVKKFGLFAGDEPAFATVADALGLPRITRGGAGCWARHPLVFVMEAADDITYNLVDLEDAFTTGELPFEAVRDAFAAMADLQPDRRQLPDEQPAECIARLRAMAIGKAIEACAGAFFDHYPAIIGGSFSGDLVGAGALAGQFASIRRLARERIFTAPRKTELEISGRRVIANVMSGILPVYQELARVGWQAERLAAPTQQLVRALNLDLRGLKDVPGALHALADFTSGMTDRYALRISRMLSGT